MFAPGAKEAEDKKNEVAAAEKPDTLKDGEICMWRQAQDGTKYFKLFGKLLPSFLPLPVLALKVAAVCASAQTGRWHDQGNC